MKHTTLIALLFFLLSTNTVLPQGVKCKLKGTVVGRECKAVHLVRVGNENFNDIEIPVVDNKFEYEMDVPFVEAYELIFHNEWLEGGRPVRFFPDTGTIEFVLHPLQEFDKNVIAGGALNAEKIRFEKKRTERDAVDSLRSRRVAWQNQYIKEHIDIFSYYLLFFDLIQYPLNRETLDMMFVTDIYPKFAQKYPSHPYTKQIVDLLEGAKYVKIGGQYIDFTAYTIDGKVIRLSDQIKGKVAVIDFWSSWCCGSINTSKSMIPVYEKYKDKGFTIVGIACESKSQDKFNKILKENQYPWLNLVEINNEFGIRYKYKLVNTGGTSLVVDKEGKIIASVSSAEQLDKLLAGLLK